MGVVQTASDHHTTQSACCKPWQSLEVWIRLPFGWWEASLKLYRRRFLKNVLIKQFWKMSINPLMYLDLPAKSRTCRMPVIKSVVNVDVCCICTRAAVPTQPLSAVVPRVLPACDIYGMTSTLHMYIYIYISPWFVADLPVYQSPMHSMYLLNCHYLNHLARQRPWKYANLQFDANIWQKLFTLILQHELQLKHRDVLQLHPSAWSNTKLWRQNRTKAAKKTKCKNL